VEKLIYTPQNLKLKILGSAKNPKIRGCLYQAIVAQYYAICIK
jgi:hypothetical protein